MTSPVATSRRGEFQHPASFTKLRDLERHGAFERVEQHQHVVPDPSSDEIGPADGDADCRAFLPLLRLLRSSSGVKPADLKAVSPALPAQQRLFRAKRNQVPGKLAQRDVVF